MENNKLENDIHSFYTELISCKKEYLQLFSDLQIQIEGWFRGELMHYFKENRYDMTTENREERIPNQDPKKRKKADFKIKVNGEWCWIELKHILIGHQKSNNRFKISDYFRSYNSFAVINDIDKLTNVKPDSAYVLAFVLVDDDSITSKNGLERELKQLSDKYNIRADKIAVDFDNDIRFGYFVLKLKS